MKQIIECVPNFSEGRDMAVIKQITDVIESVEGIKLLDVDPGAATNRTVVTFVGEPENVCNAAFLAVKKASELIDMSKHHGAHPRFGATDVCPLIPVSNITMEQTVEYARKLAKRIGEELSIPVYCYESAAFEPKRRNLANCRSGEYEALAKRIGSLVDADNKSIISYRNLDTVKMVKPEYAEQKLEEFRNNGKESFSITDPDGNVLNTIYYSDSLLLMKLQFYPYVQMILIAIFIIMGYVVLNVSRKSEQNHVWLGMSKETAHQLGTPISSLMAWLEIMREEHGETEMFREIEKDVKRLEKIAARFSKIGSKPNLHENELTDCIRNTVTYLKTRIPSTVHIETNINYAFCIHWKYRLVLFCCIVCRTL